MLSAGPGAKLSEPHHLKSCWGLTEIQMEEPTITLPQHVQENLFDLYIFSLYPKLILKYADKVCHLCLPLSVAPAQAFPRGGQA